MVFMRPVHSGGISANTIGTISAKASPVLSLWLDLSHRKKPMANVPSSAPREYEPIAASMVSATIAMAARLTHLSCARVVM